MHRSGNYRRRVRRGPGRDRSRGIRSWRVNDTGSDCKLVSGGTTIQQVYADTFAVGTSSTRYGWAPFAFTDTVTLTATGSVEIDCRSADTSGDAATLNVSMTAVAIDTLN